MHTKYGLFFTCVLRRQLLSMSHCSAKCHLNQAAVILNRSQYHYSTVYLSVIVLQHLHVGHSTTHSVRVFPQRHTDSSLRKLSHRDQWNVNMSPSLSICLSLFLSLSLSLFFSPRHACQGQIERWFSRLNRIQQFTCMSCCQEIIFFFFLAWVML